MEVWTKYLWPELVMASMVRVAVAPAWNRISYSTLIVWYLCKLSNQVKVHMLVVGPLVNEADGKSRTRHVLSDSHHRQLQSGLIIKNAKHKV